MYLMVRDGAPLPQPLAVPASEEGAALLAELYAFPSAPHGWVRAMMNTTIDGAVCGADGTSGSLRNPDDSFVFGVLRALADAVLVGAATVRAEDYRRPQGRGDLLSPSLRPGGGDRPALVIWSNSGDLPGSVEADWPTYLLAAPQALPAAQRRSGLPAAQVLPAASAGEALARLRERGLRGIQAEGGPASLGRLAEEGLLDELCLSVSHRTVGGPSSRVISGALHDQRWSLQSLLVGQHATITRYVRRR